MKNCIISLDGVDKCGKDSIKDAIIKATNGEVLVIARSFISQIAYNRIYNRQINEKYFIKMMKKFGKLGVKFVLLTASEDELIKRFDKHDEKDLPKEDIQTHLQIFYNVALHMPGQILVLDTSTASVDECVKSILEWCGVE